MPTDTNKQIIKPIMALAPFILAEMLKALYMRVISQISSSNDTIINITATPISIVDMDTCKSGWMVFDKINCANFSMAPEKPIKAPGKYGNLANACVPKISIALIDDDDAALANM